MKILIVSNLYPPYYVGGYEIRCAMVAEGLRQAGHDVRVLTSTYGLKPGKSRQYSREEHNGVPVQRILGQYVHGPRPPHKPPYVLTSVTTQLKDAGYFIQTLDEFKPDVVNWWSTSGLSKAILPIPNLRGIPDLAFIEDDWIVMEQEREREGRQGRPQWASLWSPKKRPWCWHPWLIRVMEAWKRRVTNKGIPTSPDSAWPRNACFVSEYLRSEFEAAGFAFDRANVVYGGIPVKKFFFKREASPPNHEPVRFLYAGAITRNRGLHTAVEGLNLLPPDVRPLATLTVAGEALDPAYFRELNEQARALGLSGKVIFIGKKAYDEMPAIYRSHDVLITPTLRKEGLPLTMIEAMLSGCAVVTTGSGGAMEVARLADLPLFPKEDAGGLCRILETLIRDHRALCEIATRGQEVALREFTSERMLAEIEKTLLAVAKNKARAPAFEVSDHPLRSEDPSSLPVQRTEGAISSH